MKESAENMGPITMGLRTAGRIANVLSDVPVLSEFMKPVEWMTNLLSGFSSSLGWSKPRELTGQEIVVQQLFRYAGTTEGPDLSFPGGVSCLNRLETIDYGSFTTEDEMSLAYLYQVPYYWKELTWTSTSGQGTSLLTQKLSPLSFLNTDSDTVGAHTTSYEYHVPFTYLARMHKFWRGSLVLTLKFVKTQMHSGRIQVSWIPCNLPNVTPGIATAAFNKRMIIDIRTEDTISIELPYLLYTDYAPTTPITPTLDYSGQVDIVVLNDLRAPESCSQSIAIQCFLSAGDDFELAVPSQISSGPVPYVPQSDGKELVRESINQGMTMPSMEIGGKNTGYDPLFHAKRCVGERIISIKSYLMRNSVINTFTGSPFLWSNFSKIVIDPYFISSTVMVGGSGDQTASQFVGDLFSLLAPCYAFMRGSVKFTLIDMGQSANPSSRQMSSVLPAPGFFATQPFNGSVVANTGQFAADIALAGTSGVYPLVTCNFNEEYNYSYQHIPYYSRLPMMLTAYYNGLDSPTSDPGRPVSTWCVSQPSAFSADVVFQRAVGDDFQLTFFTGCPPLATSHS